MPDTQLGDGAPPEAETRMRRALGLLPSSAPRPRNRGADTVVVVEHRGERGTHGAAHHGSAHHSSVNRVALAEAALLEERQAREHLARQLREAEAALREAQTKRGHAELAHNEAVAALVTERGAREAAEEQLRTMRQAVVPRFAASRSATAEAAMADDAAPPPRRRGRPPGSKAKLPLPPAIVEFAPPEHDGAVEWWVPGWRERI